MARRRMPAWQAAPLWAALRLAGLAVTPLPRSWELALGAALGRLALRVDRRRRRVVEENLRHCLPELGEAGRADLLRRNFEHYGRLFFELAHVFSPLPGHYARWARRHTRLHGREHWAKALERGKGVLFVSSHVGNWELMAAAGALHGFPFVIVTRRLTPDWLMACMERQRASVNLTAAYQPRTLPTVLKALKRGGTAGFVIDQYASAPEGVKALFFGVEVETLSVVGPLAARTGAAIIPGSGYRDEAGVVHTVLSPALELGEALADPAASTQAFASIVEGWVRAHPDQWLWGHRRFKNSLWPDGTPAYKL
ncbi:MAG: lysophospholipid acyltransferase family protein [Elusimicrobia bacterium]|nr:lysophospholipid acyltransferase family protein [Elusimicrobiota bacterium]